ncbi:MAG: Dabb family protein [Acidimicrobiales bacterium]
MTIRHVVCFRFVEGTTTEQVVAMAEGLRTLPGRIPEIAAYSVGPDLGLADDTWDFAVCADFATTADYDTYRGHPEHQERIRTLVRPILAERAAVQLRL